LTKLEETKMQALLVVDVQNEFSGKGLRTVPNYEKALRRIARHVEEAREAGWPIAWVQHFNKPHESKAFVPKTWGSQLSPGMGPHRILPPNAFSQRTCMELSLPKDSKIG